MGGRKVSGEDIPVGVERVLHHTTSAELSIGMRAQARTLGLWTALDSSEAFLLHRSAMESATR
jgi:hypothetical protein